MSTAKKKIISLEVRDEYILGSGVSIGAVGSFDSVVLRVKFDDSWIGLNIYATWTDALGNVGDQTIITALDLVDGEIDTYDIPVSYFATQHAGTVKLSFSGYVLGGESDKTVESVVNTVSGAFRVLESNATRLDGGNTAASVAEQLLGSQNEFEKEMLEIQEGFEEQMKAAEETREANEIARINNETARQQAENKRDEDFKKSEAARESEHEAAEKKRAGLYDTMKNLYDNGVIGRIGVLPSGEKAEGSAVFNSTAYNGSNNEAEARSATVFGFNNKILQNYQYPNTLYEVPFSPDPCMVLTNCGNGIWENRQQNGWNAFLAGTGNILTARSGIGLGENSRIAGDKATAVGYRLVAYSAEQTVVGAFNEADFPLDKDGNPCNDTIRRGKYAFIVGGGTPAGGRKNVFAVTWNGDVVLADGKTIKEHISDAISGIVGTAPETMDTLAEIATLMGSADKEATILGDIVRHDKLLGDVETSLDQIIAIQEILLGVRIKFSVGNETFYADPGITWVDWVESEYNTGEFKISNNNIVRYIYGFNAIVIHSSTSSPVTVDEVIERNGEYSYG